MLTPESSKGHTLVEIMIAMVILGILLALAAQNYGVWIANSRIRTATETLVEGLSAARNEAIKRNRPIGFRLMTNLSSSCTASPSGTSWVASLDDPKHKCDVDISDTDAPFIVAKKSAGEGTATVTIEADASTVIFNGLGRVVLVGASIAQIDIASSAVSAAQSRPLRITLTSGGMVRMCDPSISDPKDTRKC